MAAIKACKQGNSIMITIPSVLGVKEGEYYLSELDVGYVPGEGEPDEI